MQGAKTPLLSDAAVIVDETKDLDKSELEKQLVEAAPKVLNRLSFQDPPESTPWYRPLGWLFVSVVMLIIVLFNLAFLPLLLIAMIVRGIIFSNLKYHREPKDLKIGIIGGGWAGLQACARFKELGVENVTCFERYDHLGGTWHPNLCYHGLTIHGAMWTTSFSMFPYSEADPKTNTSKFMDEMDGRVNAQEVRRYVRRFAKEKGVLPHYKMNSTVMGIDYDTATRKATVKVTDASGKDSEEGGFDMVIYAAQSSYYDIPKVQGQEDFKGKIYHSMQFRTPEFNDVISNNKKVLVVGGGKGGSDMVINFVDADYKNYEWAVRKNYVFWKYERVFHDRSVLNMFGGFFGLMCFTLSIVFPQLAMLVNWSLGIFCSYGPAHLDAKKFHFGVLSPCQRRSIAKATYRQTEPVKYTSNGVEFKDGTYENFDVVIWATGCRSGFDKLVLNKDNKTFDLAHTAAMYNHFIVPDFPVLASSTQLWTQFGPCRANNTAELATYHLCCRPVLSEEEMLKRTGRQIANSRSATKSFLFHGESVAMAEWIKMHIDLLIAGVTTIPAFLMHGFESFVFNRQTSLVMDIIPGGDVKTPGTPSVPTSFFAVNACIFFVIYFGTVGAAIIAIWQAIVGWTLF